jgi:hypothetical protein
MNMNSERIEHLLGICDDVQKFLDGDKDVYDGYHALDIVENAAEPLATGFRLLLERMRAAESALRSHGYRKSCDIPACNCGDQWAHGGNASQRLQEISEVVEHNGKTILEAVEEIVAKNTQLEAEAKAKELTYTTEKPTVEGWYWRKFEGRETIIRIDEFNSELVQWLSSSTLAPVSGIRGEFSGPITQRPKEPSQSIEDGR